MSATTKPSAFADRFTLAGLTHTACEKPSGELIPHKHVEWDLGGQIGKVHLDIYQPRGTDTLVARAYRWADGETRWYRVELAERAALSSGGGERASLSGDAPKEGR